MAPFFVLCFYRLAAIASGPLGVPSDVIIIEIAFDWGEFDGDGIKFNSVIIAGFGGVG